MSEIIKLEECDARWLDQLTRGVELASEIRQSFAEYLANKYAVDGNVKLDLKQKAFIKTKPEHDTLSGKE